MDGQQLSVCEKLCSPVSALWFAGWGPGSGVAAPAVHAALHVKSTPATPAAHQTTRACSRLLRAARAWHRKQLRAGSRCSITSSRSHQCVTTWQVGFVELKRRCCIKEWECVLYHVKSLAPVCDDLAGELWSWVSFGAGWFVHGE